MNGWSLAVLLVLAAVVGGTLAVLLLVSVAGTADERAARITARRNPSTVVPLYGRAPRRKRPRRPVPRTTARRN